MTDRVSSMTGFGRSSGSAVGRAWVWELKSVNGKGLDVRVRAPAGLEGVEAAARTAAKARFGRGSIQAGLQVTRDTSPDAAPALTVDHARLEALIADTRSYVDRGLADPPRLDGLLAVRGVVEASGDDLSDDDRAALSAAVIAGLEVAMDALAAARAAEGDAVRDSLVDALDRLEATVGQAASLAAAQPDALKARFRDAFTALIEDGLPEDRLAQEAAVLAVKADVREELDRLTAHVASARALLAEPAPVGRKLEFLAQEFMRESNTLCAKSADIDLTNAGLELKSIVDQFREQAANVE